MNFSRINQKTIFILLQGKIDSDLLYVVQSYTVDWTVNPLVVGSNPTSGDFIDTKVSIYSL